MVAAPCTSSTRSLRVFAAAGVKLAIDEATEEFGRKLGDSIEVTYGGAGDVLAKMMFTETGDVYVAPEQQFMESAVAQGAVAPETIRDLAYMVPVLAIRKDNPKHVSSLSDLAKPGIRVGVTRLETTCLGRYAPQIFQRVGLTDAIGKNVVTQAPRPDLLITWLLMDKIDAAITWQIYQVMAPDGIAVIRLPPEQLPGIGKMQAATAAYTKNRDLASRFVEFLASADGKAIFEKHGYIVDGDELKKYWPGE